MRTSTSSLALTFLSLLLPSSLSHPTSQFTTRQNTAAQFLVTQYNTGCSPAGCTYGFNISYTAPACSAGSICEPSFSTFCQGTDIQGGYRECEDALITTDEVPETGNSTLTVQHQWDQDYNGEDARFWAVANTTVAIGVGEFNDRNASFVVPVVELRAIE
jgi:hypothetical protein